MHLADEQVSSVSSAGNVLWPLSDHLGTIRDTADYDEGDPDFEITNHRVYDSFGRLESETNSAVDLSFGFTGKYTDDATGHTHHLNRWYDPTTGRWLSEDPIGFAAGDTNFSRYVGNDPVHYVDPTGLLGVGYTGPASDSPAVQDDDEKFNDFQNAIRGTILVSGIPYIRDLAKPDANNQTGFDGDDMCALAEAWLEKKLPELGIDAQVSVVGLHWSQNLYGGTLPQGGHAYIQIDFNGASFLLEPQTGQIGPKPQDPKDVVKQFETPGYTPIDPEGGSVIWSSDPKWGRTYSSALDLYSELLPNAEPHPATRPKELTESTYNGIVERGYPELAEVFKGLDEWLTEMRYKEPMENRFNKPSDRRR